MLRNQELKIMKLKNELKRKHKELKTHLRILEETSKREVETKIRLQGINSQLRKDIKYQDGEVTKLKDELDEKRRMLTRHIDPLMCKICFDMNIEVLFMPCCHLISCHKCASRLQERCPICRNEIHYTISVIFG